MGATLPKEQQLRIKILAGETQSQQLFDYHSPQKQQSISGLCFPSIIGIKDGDLIYLPEDNQYSGILPLYRLELKHKHWITIRELFERSGLPDDCRIWKVLAEGEEMDLQQGDEIKIGKTKITFKQLVKKPVPDRPAPPADKNETSRTVPPKSQEAKPRESEDACRVCFEGSSTYHNPLVSLCKCKGSVKFIHLQCWKDWKYNSVKKDKTPNCLFYSYTEPDCCELCRQPLKTEFRCNEQIYNFCQLEKIDPPYAVFQNRSPEDSTGKTLVSVYALAVPENSQVTIGRNHTSQVVLRDISVSRSHCFLVFRHGRLYIQDNKSKFGTLVRTKRGVSFDAQCRLQLQLQSKVVEISQTEVFNDCCLATSNSYFVEINKGIHEPVL